MFSSYHLFTSTFLCTSFRWIEVDKILDVRDEEVTEVVDEHPPPVTAGTCTTHTYTYTHTHANLITYIHCRKHHLLDFLSYVTLMFTVLKFPISPSLHRATLLYYLPLRPPFLSSVLLLSLVLTSPFLFSPLLSLSSPPLLYSSPSSFLFSPLLSLFSPHS